MSFFHHFPGAGDQAEQWTVSPKFWLYWVVTIPVTLLTIGSWLLFTRKHRSPVSVTPAGEVSKSLQSW